MKKSIEKFFEFKGRSISFLNVDGLWWIALKPICDVLNVDYIRQFKNTKEDQILGQLLSEQTMVAADGKLRKMVCLPEKYIYGWLFSLRSESEELMQFKEECYNILFEHFHGGATGQMKMEKLKNTAEIELINKRISESQKDDPDHKRLKELESINISIGKSLSKFEKEIDIAQLEIFREQLSEN